MNIQYNSAGVVLNVFQLVVPKGSVYVKAKLPIARRGRAPGSLRVLDRNGNINAPLAPRTYGSITIEGREQGQSSLAKRQALVKGSM